MAASEPQALSILILPGEVFREHIFATFKKQLVAKVLQAGRVDRVCVLGNLVGPSMRDFSDALGLENDLWEF